MLHTHLTNDAARCLIENRLIPGLEDAVIVRREVPMGRSRFDFLLRDGQGDVLLEVKSCISEWTDMRRSNDPVWDL